MGKSAMVMEVPGKGKTGRPKRRWLDNIRNDLSEIELVEDRTVRGGSARPSSMEEFHKKHRPHLNVGKDGKMKIHYSGCQAVQIYETSRRNCL